MIRKKEKRKFRFMSIMYVIRHAQASFGQAVYDRLSDPGRRQAQILADHFASLGLTFDAIYTGRQVRHEQTLTPYLDSLAQQGQAPPPVHTTDALNEYDSETIIKTLIPELIREDPAFASEAASMIRDKRSFQKVYETIMGRWVRGADPIENLETWPAYARRVTAGLKDIIASEGSGKAVAVFTSGGPISIYVQKALGLSDDMTLAITWQIINASVTRFKFSGDRLMLFGFNDVSHLERTKDQQLITYR